MEFTEGEAPDTSGYDDQGGYEEQAGYDGGYEGQPTPAVPPDLGEAIRQMNAQQEFLQRPQPDPGYQEDAGYGPEFGEPGPDAMTPEAAAQQLVQQAVSEQLGPILEAQESERRESAILDLAEHYPNLREPEVLDVVSDKLDGIADRVGDPNLRTDPELVEYVYLAFEAMRSMENGAQAETPQTPPATQLETGAGPGPPQQAVDPVEKAYMTALNGEPGGSDIIGSR